MIDDFFGGNGAADGSGFTGIVDKNGGNVSERSLTCGGEPSLTSVKEMVRGGARARVGEAPQEDASAWRLEPHICRACHSRLASSPTQGGGRRYECTNCGLHADGHDASVLCCCGMKVRRPNRNGAGGHRLVDAFIRCALNPNPTPDFPSLYVAFEVPET